MNFMKKQLLPIGIVTLLLASVFLPSAKAEDNPVREKALREVALTFDVCPV